MFYGEYLEKNESLSSSSNTLLALVAFILVAVAAILILYLLADAFYEVAKKKGHSEKKYFWFPFIFGFAGYMLVIALPNNLTSQNSDHSITE